MPVLPETDLLLRHLATRPGHDEVKADFRDLLVREFGVALGAVDFERRDVEIRGRLDALVGRTVFEAKSNLDDEWADVARRMPDYLGSRERESGERFIGVASDGLKWIVLELRDGALAEIKRTTLDPEKGEAFLAWLDGAVALQSSLPPDALTIRAELGQDSVAFHLVDAGLRALWDEVRTNPTEALKRQLWADLLKQVYGREVESDALWFQHSYLVIIAKCIALAVMRLAEDDPKRMLSGEAFAAAGITGAVESDFFDWVAATPAGEALVRRIMSHVRRFRLSEVESDVLKVLYESLIDRAERHGLGEYYTPDWMAAKVVRHAVDRPVEQKVLDPACGSGTFLFQAVRHFLTEAVDAGIGAADRAREACDHVAGTDIHPVAVIIARVTYLLALAPALNGRSGVISIPVWLGDAMQLSISQVLTGRELVIRVPPPPAGTPGDREQLSFPDTFCRDPALFDKAIERLRTASLADMSRDAVEAALGRITEQHYRQSLTAEQQLAIGDMGETYLLFDRLRREGRDTIWAYVARNLSRPLALSSSGGWANVLVGNPPWVAYRHMSSDLKTRFKGLARAEQIYDGRAPSQNDLSALFVARSSQLYLRSGGRLAFVLPLAAMTRTQFAPLRSGDFQSSKIAWSEAWVMDYDLQPLFPVPSCVLFGRKRGTAVATPDRVVSFSGLLPLRDADEATADRLLTRLDDVSAPSEARSEGGSPYREAFRCGANLFPRALLLVERQSSGRLGSDESAPLVASRRSTLENEPWSLLPSVQNRVEQEFLRPVLLGESILPFRLFQQFEGVIPVRPDGSVLSSQMATEIDAEGLAGWLSAVESLWNDNGKGSRTFAGQINYIGQLSAQFPVPALRVVYAKAGIHPAAHIIRDSEAVLDHKLYWTAPDDEDEAYYLVAILNSETTRARAEGYQSRGQFGARDFDKVMFNLPIPRFDRKVALHRQLATAGRAAESSAQVVELRAGEKFQRARKRIRDALSAGGISARIERLVEKLLDG